MASAVMTQAAVVGRLRPGQPLRLGAQQQAPQAVAAPAADDHQPGLERPAAARRPGRPSGIGRLRICCKPLTPW